MTNADYCDMNHIRTVADPGLPYSVKSFVYVDRAGEYCIVVNANLDPAERRKAADHEIRHIKRGDCWNKHYIEYA